MTEQTHGRLEKSLASTALAVREHVLCMATGGGCFIGASLSCVEILVYLYRCELSVSPDRLTDPDRDYLFLSKGHDVPALYGTLAELGFIERSLLRRHLFIDSNVYWHPNRSVPGIEFHSGSLGHLLSVAMGVALDIKLRGGKNRVFVIVGDGELNEGSMWEGLLVASALLLDNLVVVVDRNGFQANMKTEDLVPLEPLREKFESFGLRVHHADGHDFADLGRAFDRARAGSGRPEVVMARTVRGKGLPSIESRADRWFCNFTRAEIEMLLEELHAGTRATITSQVLVVR
ncbi:MAG TPA: 1-deoxy-D-xylulose-5-phosphate synthase N-terminal domain-containing protein [Polyangiaceae bacterium]|nr:1-deoxy-D-xylulose-5-phosphate synthase N-terminal domain-containing protein [Polyangiaceae bacterium]